MKKRSTKMKVLLFSLALIFISATTINNFFMPGSQPGQSGNLETPDRCDNCHGGYDSSVEPAFNWRGSMMAQAARDPLFWACLAIAEQDAPGSGDLCIRCHAPDGWLNGRSEPTSGAALNNNDRQGVQCDFCHKLVKPTPIGVNPYPNDPSYTSGTYSQDQSYLSELKIIPGSSSNGMYVVDKNNAKRGPYDDAVGRHKMFYSPFHRESALCGTCHDVSNPAFTRSSVNDTEYKFNGYDNIPPSFDLRLQFPVERTFSEWTISDFNDPVQGKSCQSCHMKKVTGKGAKMKDAPVRTDLALHDMTGGNTFIPDLIKHQFPSEVDAAALDAGKERAKAQLESAADILINVSGNTATVRVVNKTGHKLPSGYPEGRRIWVNVKAYNGNQVVYESGAYDYNTAHLDIDGTKIYEIKPGFSPQWAAAIGKEAGPSFHFAINNAIFYDNRIPPKGATNAELIAIQSPVVGYSYADNQHWDETTYTLPTGFDRVEARLFYQTLSSDYVTFLRDENRTNSRGKELYDLWEIYGKSAPVLMTQVHWGNIVQPQSIVKDLSVALKASSGGKYLAEATVLITKNNAPTYTPIGGAMVYATWTYGNQSGKVSGTTLASGQVVLRTPTIKNATGQWCFNIDNVVATGYDFAGGNTFACTAVTKSYEIVSEYPIGMELMVYPNPIAEFATFSFSLDEPARIVIEVFNIRGRKVEVVVNQTMGDGNHSLTWNTSGLSSGVYLIRFTSGGKSAFRSVVIQ
jgi:hypothetical protein